MTESDQVKIYSKQEAIIIPPRMTRAKRQKYRNIAAKRWAKDKNSQVQQDWSDSENSCDNQFLYQQEFATSENSNVCNDSDSQGMSDYTDSSRSTFHNSTGAVFQKIPKRIREIGSKPQSEVVDNDNSVNYIIIDDLCLRELIKNFKCRRCDSLSLETQFTNRTGFVMKIDIKCVFCESNGEEELEASFYTSRRIVSADKTRCFDVNLRLATAFRHIGRGYSAIEQFFMCMNMTPFASSTFHELSKIVTASTE